MRAGSARIVAGARQIALTVGAVAGVLCILVTVAGFAFGVRPLVFQSGSMSPTIDTGALAIARPMPSRDLHVGDIVSVPTPTGERVTHRIVSVEHQGGEAIFRLKGDANEAADVSPYRVDQADVVLFSVPQLGYVLGWLASPVGIFALGLYAAFLVSVVARGAGRRRTAAGTAPADTAAPVAGRRRRFEARHRVVRPALALPFTAVFYRKVDARHRLALPLTATVRHRKGDARHRVARPAFLVPFTAVFHRKVDARHRVVRPAVTPPFAATIRRRRGGARHRVVRPALLLPLTAVSVSLTAITMVAGTLALGWTQPTRAAWTDPVTVSGTTQTAYTVPAPDGSTCAVLDPGDDASRGVNLTWPSNTAPLPLLAYDAEVTGVTGATTSVVTVGSTKELQVRYDPSTVANQNKIVTVTATPRLTSAATWTGPVTTWKFRTGGTAATQPICGDATPAVVVIRAPDGVTRTPTAERAFISGATGCAADTGLCGTVEDASTIAGVTYVLSRTQGASVHCFDGTSWVTTCDQVTALSTTFQNELTFFEDATTGTVYPDTGTGSYTLTVTVTDSWANVTTTAVSFTLN